MAAQCTAEELERIVDCYGTAMLRVCMTYLKDENLAQDAVQDSFVKIMRSWPGFSTPEVERSWIMRVTVNVCKDQLRTAWRKRVTLVENYPEIPAEQTPKDEPGMLFCAIQNLKPRYKEVIILYYYQQLQVSEIAKALHAPQSTVSVRLKRARKELERALQTVPVEER